MQQLRSVVVADDNNEICELLVEILTDSGYSVDTVNNGYELLSYLETKTPAIIILDLMMPEKGGLSIIDTLRQVSPYSRLIIYTGYKEYENSVYARAADRFLIKGDSVEKLITAVKELS